MESAAQAVLAYVNSQIGKSEYNGMALREAFSAIIEDADEDTRKGWMSSVTLKDGYFYCVSCTSTEETYRTDLFNQGKTALVATTLVMDESQSEICGWKWTQKPEKWPNDIGVCVIEVVRIPFWVLQFFRHTFKLTLANGSQVAAVRSRSRLFVQGNRHFQFFPDALCNLFGQLDTFFHRNVLNRSERDYVDIGSA